VVGVKKHGLPDAEVAKTRKGRERNQFEILVFLLRPLRNLRVLCVPQPDFDSLAP
jgi:hypothetical protein